MPRAQERRSTSLSRLAARVQLRQRVGAVELISWTPEDLAARRVVPHHADVDPVLAAERRERPRVLVLTSASPKEGKTTVVSNLSIALAEINQRVLVIDGDMRRPRLHKVFDVANRLRPERPADREDAPRRGEGRGGVHADTGSRTVGAAVRQLQDPRVQPAPLATSAGAAGAGARDSSTPSSSTRRRW